MTIILRIKGSDLQALREGTLTREEGLKRVDREALLKPETTFRCRSRIGT